MSDAISNIIGPVKLVKSSSMRRNLNPPVCSCGFRTKIITSWTDANPGRRFAVCRLSQEEACGVWEWCDPQMCQRSIEVIPGLLRRINELEKDKFVAEADARRLDSSVSTLEKEKNLLQVELKKTRGKLRALTIFVLLCCGVMLCIFQWRTATQNVGTSMRRLEGF